MQGLPESYETEGLDRKHLNLPGAQLEMIRVLKQYNPNLIVVLNNGCSGGDGRLKTM